MIVGYQASHEQFAPSRMLSCAQAAEQAGFAFVNSSDHFHPWSARDSACGFAWSWLGSAMQSTRCPYSVVTAPIQRHNPAIIAQAAATLDEMYPGRLTLALGSGELLNEGITGQDWPVHAVRHARLREAADIMRRLWSGEEVTHEGLVTVREARLYTLPSSPLQLFSAALSLETAEDAGTWADGLLTTMRPIEELQRMFEGFRARGGAGKPVAVKVDVAWGADERQALEAACAAWRGNSVGRRLVETLRTPADFDAASACVTADDMRGSVRTGPAETHLGWLRQLHELGVDRVIVHDVTPEQETFIGEFGREVLGRLEQEKS